MQHSKECPVRALGRRIVHIWKQLKLGKAFLCLYWYEVGRASVTDSAIRLAVKYAAGCLDYPGRGIPLIRVDTHLLRSGGACALSLSGHKPHEIMKMGRWEPNSPSFMKYAQEEISTFSAGMSIAMFQIAPFTNMEGTITAEDLRADTIH